MSKSNSQAYLRASLDKIINSPEFKKQLAAKGAELCNEAANEFCQILTAEINSNPMIQSNGKEALSVLDISPVKQIDENNLLIEISFGGNMYRPSAADDYFSGIQDIAQLINNGSRSPRNVISGYWHGYEGRFHIPNSPRSGAHFAQNAARTFESTSAQKYGIKSVIINDKYK